jgi:hypothetical protein
MLMATDVNREQKEVVELISTEPGNITIDRYKELGVYFIFLIGIV